MDDKKKEEANKLAQQMAKSIETKRESQRASYNADRPTLTFGSNPNKSPRTSKRDSAFEGVKEGSEALEVAERALTRQFRVLADVFASEKKSPVAQKNLELDKYGELIEAQEKLLNDCKDQTKAKKLLDEHKEMLNNFREQLKQ